MTCPFKCDRPEDNVIFEVGRKTVFLTKIYIKAAYEPEEQCDHDKVGEEGSEPDNLPRRMETLLTHLVQAWKKTLIILKYKLIVKSQ